MALIQHIGMNCRDKDRQEAFYTKHFGFKRSRVFNPGRPDEFVMLRLGDVRLELFPAAAEQRAQRGGEQPIGFKHLAIEVADLDETIRRLNQDGVRTEGVIDCSGDVKGMRICFFDDPDGNRIEIMQGYQDQY